MQAKRGQSQKKWGKKSRRLNFGVTWVEKISNKKVLRRMEMEETVLVKILVNNKEKYLRERMRNDKLFATAINRKILGEATRGRKRMSLLNDSVSELLK